MFKGLKFMNSASQLSLFQVWVYSLEFYVAGIYTNPWTHRKSEEHGNADALSRVPLLILMKTEVPLVHKLVLLMRIQWIHWSQLLISARGKEESLQLRDLSLFPVLQLVSGKRMAWSVWPKFGYIFFELSLYQGCILWEILSDCS